MSLVSGLRKGVKIVRDAKFLYDVGKGITRKGNSNYKKTYKKKGRRSGSRGGTYGFTKPQSVSSGKRGRKRAANPFDSKVRKICRSEITKAEKEIIPFGDFLYYDNNVMPLGTYNKQVASESNGLINYSFLDPGSILDAAAVMYNAKVCTNNSRFTLAGNFDNDSQITILNGSLTMKFKNNSTISGVLKAYVCTAKSDLPTNETPLTKWTDCYNAYTLKTTGTYASNSINGLFEVPPKEFYHDFNVKTYSKHLVPGGEFDINIKCGKHTLDSGDAKIINADVNYSSMIKGLTKSVMYVFIPDPFNHVISKGQGVRSYNLSVLPADNTRSTMLIEYILRYRIQAPAETAIANKHQVMSKNVFIPANVEITNPLTTYQSLDRTNN